MSDKREREGFWSKLAEVVESFPVWKTLVIGADFSGHVGKWKKGDEEVSGRYEVYERNAERLN